MKVDYGVSPNGIVEINTLNIGDIFLELSKKKAWMLFRKNERMFDAVAMESGFVLYFDKNTKVIHKPNAVLLVEGN